MFDLQALALSLLQLLVVRHLLDEQPDFASEVALQILACRGSVLDRVVQEGRDQRRGVRDAANVREDAGYFERMVDGGRGINALPSWPLCRSAEKLSARRSRAKSPPAVSVMTILSVGQRLTQELPAYRALSSVLLSARDGSRDAPVRQGGVPAAAS